MTLHSRDKFAQPKPRNPTPDFSDSVYWLTYDDVSNFQPVAEW